MITEENQKTNLDLDQSYWNSRWNNNETGWDVGYASPAITNYLEKIEDKNIAILIPGCGNAYEAEYLLKNGFENITLIDIAPKAVQILKDKFRNDPQIKVVLGDFFEHEGQYDLMLEQTFFCALPRDLRPNYAKKASEILKPNAKIVGVMFNTNFEHQGPPFGGSVEEYKTYFEPYFKIKTMEDCYNSILPRQGSEVFIQLEVKK
jgi:SAM-dependent methyltransferase